MPDPTSHRSTRFTQAAESERNRLSRKRAKLSKQREGLQHKLDTLDAELEAVDREIVVLDGLTTGGHGSVTLELATGPEQGSALKGAAIREIAVPLLMAAQGTAPIHYRAWLDLLVEHGYEVAGKRPDAVFLNQVVRSPLVRASTQAGYYQLDLDAPDRLREQLGQQQAALSRLLAVVPEDAGALERQREEQRESRAAIAKTERALEEALRVLADSSAPQRPEVHVRHAA